MAVPRALALLALAVGSCAQSHDDSADAACDVCELDSSEHRETTGRVPAGTLASIESARVNEALGPPLERDPVDSLTVVTLDEAKRALDAGLPDPRGLALHTITLRRRDPDTGAPVVVRAEGFVLPGGREVITLRGTIEPVLAIGAPLDIPLTLRRQQVAYRSSGNTGASVEAPGLGSVVAIYARLLGTPVPTRWDADPELLRQSLFYEYQDRALDALSWRDDATAIAQGGRASALIGSLDPRVFHWGHAFEGRQLCADLRRRAREGDGPAVPDDLERASVSELIEALDEIDGPPCHDSSRTCTLRHPIGRALVARGTTAIEPLLQVFEHDRRTTRLIREPFSSPVTVDYTALNVVYAIVGYPPTEPGVEIARSVDALFRGRSTRGEIATDLRAHIAENTGLAPHERWYRALLEGDHALSAARLITAPRTLASTEASTRPADLWPAIKWDGLAGEPLRDGREPSVARLLRAHVRDPRSDDAGSEDFLVALERWDPAEGVTLRREMCRTRRGRRELDCASAPGDR